MRKAICILLTICLLMTTMVVSWAEESPMWGDLNQNKEVDAGDALMVLKKVVGKIELTDAVAAIADVSDNGEIDATDALMILQYVVGKITRFPADKIVIDDTMTKEEYYAAMDSMYHVNGADFADSSVTDYNDAAQVNKVLGQLPADTDVNGHQLNSEGNIIYNPISAEAKKQGTLSLYNTASKKSGSLTLQDGTVLTYSVPTDVTAYSAVPMTYSVKGGKNAQTVHVEATTYENPNRINQSAYYENTLPGNVNVSVNYLGFAQATNLNGAANPFWNANPAKDKMGTAYPPYEITNLKKSGTVPAGQETFFKFSATNNGNTILKGDGQGYFCFRPILYKQSGSAYSQVAECDNLYIRLYDHWYPGETIEFWVKFGQGGYGSIPEGNYRIELRGELANEQGSPNWSDMYVGGRYVTQSTFDFTAGSGSSTPNNVVNKQVKTATRNSWLGVYEEFQTSFHTHLYVDTAKAEQDTLYFQPAPWDTALTLRLISESSNQMKLVTIPLKVESDSVSLTLNPFNENYVVKADGTREPILGTQHMADMRGNYQYEPYAMDVLVNDFKDMEEAGINYLTSTMAFTYTTGSGNIAVLANRVMMDMASLLGFKLEGYGMYPYEGSVSKAASITKPYAGVTAAYGNNKVNGILNTWTYERFGDMYWSNPQGITPIAQEDSRGWMTIDHDWRMDLTDESVADLQEWLKETYGTIAALNRAYGSDFSAFSDIDPRVDGTINGGHYDFTGTSYFSVYHEKSKAMRDLDLFRTVKRIRDYKESLMVTGVPNPKMIARYEGSPLITVGLKPTTKNPHYRETYYQMYRAGLVGELLAASDYIYGTSTYVNTPYTPSETYELTKHAQLAGLHTMNYHMSYRDQIYNTFYGDGKADVNLHLKNGEMKVTSINTYAALFPTFKATYEAGGANGIMWMDYYCNGFVTSTKYKELQFYTEKVQEMLSTEQGAKWATDFDATGSLVNKDATHVWSYDKAYLANAYVNTPRRDKFNLK
ncbi:MAG: hypothetical protein IJP35_00015 [Clostridia bacterium]|nr:hypothetical protein [Clostridia bacterium]